MAKYERDDIVTYYFIIMNENGNKRIQAWTDNKEYAKFYLEFHNTKNFSIKKLTKPLREMIKILEENANDEIQIAPNIIIKNRDKKHKYDDFKTITIPATRMEISFINEEVATFMLSQVNYSYLDSAIPYLKNKYQRALNEIFLQSIIKKVCYQRDSKIVQSIHLDNLMILFRSFPDMFGK